MIPSWKTIDERLQSAPWHTVDGVHYGVPYDWGSNVLMYNTEVFKEPPKSWNVVFEEMNLPDGKSNNGRVQAFDGPIYIADAALYLMKKKPELGIKDPYELNEDQYKAALELLRGQRKLVGRYWHDAMVQIDDFKNEGVAASSSWPFQVNLLKGEKKPKHEVSGIIATFTAPPFMEATGFTTSIDWGDGTSSLGEIVWNSTANRFDVIADHRYEKKGIYSLLITITDPNGQTSTATSSVVVQTN